MIISGMTMGSQKVMFDNEKNIATPVTQTISNLTIAVARVGFGAVSDSVIGSKNWFLTADSK
jgi:hypothetical protein